MPRPILATIDIDAMRHNLARARQLAGHRKVWAVVKANAYGHGLERAVRGFAEADGLALLDLDEARRARAAGWQKPILLLEGFFEPADLEIIDALQLTTVVHQVEQIDMLAAGRPNAPIDVYLKLQTGMNRLGFDAESSAALEALRRLQSLPQVKLVALAMHFANADRLADGPAQPEEQWRRFDAIARHWRGPICVANSAALFLRPEIGGDAVRPGIVLYGGTPQVGVAAAHFDLRAAMGLQSRVISVQQIRRGASVGYGSRWTAAHDTWLGVVACGYADGYPRAAPDGTPVLVDGARVPLVGRVSMDMLTVDLSELPQAGVGAAVELWGEHLPIDEVAERAGTIGYELMCGLAPRVPVTEAP
jgi:alanine racemase